MTRQRALSGVVLAYLCAALIVAGPWIFTMLGIAGLSAVGCTLPCAQLPLFRTVVIYNSMFSLVLTSPLAFFLGRHVVEQNATGVTDQAPGPAGNHDRAHHAHRRVQPQPAIQAPTTNAAMASTEVRASASTCR